MADPAFAELLTALDIVVMERLPDRSFQVLGPPPDWFAPIHGASASGDTAELERAFPFLDHFLEEAAAFWRQPAGGRLTSGPYTAKDANEVEFHFEVSTVLAERRIFLLFHLLRDFEGTRHVFQRARERTLALQKVAITRDTLRKQAATLTRHVQSLLAMELTGDARRVVDEIRNASEQLSSGIEALPAEP